MNRYTQGRQGVIVPGTYAADIMSALATEMTEMDHRVSGLRPSKEVISDAKQSARHPEVSFHLPDWEAFLATQGLERQAASLRSTVLDLADSRRDGILRSVTRTDLYTQIAESDADRKKWLAERVAYSLELSVNRPQPIACYDEAL